MFSFISKKPQFFLGTENFFLKHLFYRFNNCFRNKKNQKSSLNIRKAIISIIWLAGALNSVFAADPQFSQNMFNMLAVNPGYAGSSGMINVMAISRQQWIDVLGRPKTTVFGADAAINPFGIQSGIGINFMNDQLGYFNNISASLSYSLQTDLSVGTIGVGFSLGFFNHQFKPEDWETANGSDDDYLLLGAETSGTAMDFGLGCFYKNDNYYIGLSATNLFNTEPKFDEDYYFYLRRTYYLAGGFKYALADRPIVLHPSIFVKSDGLITQADFNVNAEFKKRYWGGLSFRPQDAIVLLAGIELKNGLRIGYSYDIGISKFSSGTGGSHEMMFSYSFDLSFEKKSKRYKSVRYL